MGAVQKEVFLKKDKNNPKKSSHPVSTYLSWLLFVLKDISVFCI